MKLFYTIIFLVTTNLLTSCEQFGIEVTTIKGDWISQPIDNYCSIMEIKEDGRCIQELYKLNDTISNPNKPIKIRTYVSTWVSHNDTLILYDQDINGGIRKLVIEQLSMSTMTLHNTTHNKRWILSRIYSTPNDYNRNFIEVFDLKKGVWWYAWNIFCLVSGIICLSAIFSGIISLVRYILDLIQRKYNN